MPAGDRGSTDGELAGLIGATQSLVRQLSRNSSGLGLGSQPRAEQQQQQQQQQPCADAPAVPSQRGLAGAGSCCRPPAAGPVQRGGLPCDAVQAGAC